MAVQREIKFVLTPQSDTSLQAALKQIQDNFSNWKLKAIRRDDPQPGEPPMGVIVVEL